MLNKMKFRVFKIGENGVKEYANRLGIDNSPPIVRWMPMSMEYPDNFTWAEFARIRVYYWKVEVYFETVRIWDAEEGLS